MTQTLAVYTFLKAGVTANVKTGERVIKKGRIVKHSREYPLWEFNTYLILKLFFLILAPIGAQGVTLCVRLSVWHKFFYRVFHNDSPKVFAYCSKNMITSDILRLLGAHQM